MRRTAQEYFYPEVAVGGFSHVSSTVDFYNRINALLRPDMTVMDFGAGSGAASEAKSPYVRELMRIKGKVARFVGADVDPVVLENPLVDEAVVIRPNEKLPFPEGAFDLIICDWVFEHIADPAPVIGELHRVLRPGGWVCARTPNRWGYIALCASLVPKPLHSLALRHAQPSRKECDVYTKFYNLNTSRWISHEFGRFGFESCIYNLDSEPAYAGSSRVAWGLFQLFFRFTPNRFRAVYHVFSRKPGRPDD